MTELFFAAAVTPRARDGRLICECNLFLQYSQHEICSCYPLDELESLYLPDNMGDYINLTEPACPSVQFGLSPVVHLVIFGRSSTIVNKCRWILESIYIWNNDVNWGWTLPVILDWKEEAMPASQKAFMPSHSTGLHLISVNAVDHGQRYEKQTSYPNISFNLN